MNTGMEQHFDLDIAHTHCIRNRKEILASELCGCFYCCGIFSSHDVHDFLDEREGPSLTAQCPRCGIDSVIGSASGFPVTPAFLLAMRVRWFGDSTQTNTR